MNEVFVKSKKVEKTEEIKKKLGELIQQKMKLQFEIKLEKQKISKKVGIEVKQQLTS